MAKYVKRLVTLLISDHSDYTQPRTYTSEETTSPTEIMVAEHLSCATVAGQDLDLTPFTTSATVWVKNHDTTNFVTVTYTTVADAAATTVKLTAGQDITLRDIDTTATFNIAADTLACECTVAKI